MNMRDAISTAVASLFLTGAGLAAAEVSTEKPAPTDETRVNENLCGHFHGMCAGCRMRGAPAKGAKPTD